MARIVICDDEPHISRAVALKLKRAGHDVRAGRNGAEALALIQAERPDLVITDCQMPVMTGLQLCEAILGEPQLSDLPVVMLTAKGLEIPEAELRSRYDVCRLVHKPFSPRDLLALVEELTSDPVAA